MATLTVKHPDFPDGHEFLIGGIGTVKNGEKIDLTDEQAQAVEHDTGFSLAQSFKDNPYFVLSGRGSGSTTEEDEEQVRLRTGSFLPDSAVSVDPTVDEEVQDEAQDADANADGKEGEE